jgi:hypothetical protein
VGDEGQAVARRARREIVSETGKCSLAGRAGRAGGLIAPMPETKLPAVGDGHHARVVERAAIEVDGPAGDEALDGGGADPECAKRQDGGQRPADHGIPFGLGIGSCVIV